mgnify:CR=1 FL=1
MDTYHIRRDCLSAFWLCRETCSVGKLRDHNLFSTEQWPLYSAGCIHKVRTINWRQSQLYPLCYMSCKHWCISHAYFFTPPQHHSISFTMTLCCCTLWWPWLHASCLSVDSVAAGAIGIALAFSVALLVLQKTPSCLDGSSSSTHSNKHQPLWIFFSLNLDDLGILQLLPLFLLASFYNASFSLHCSNNNKITEVVFVAVAFSGTKAQWGCISGRGIFAEAGQQRIQIDFCPFLSKPHLPHPTISHWKWSTPLPQICWSQGRTGWEKHTIHKSLNFTNCDMLWFAQYICELINWKFCLQDFYCVQ